MQKERWWRALLCCYFHFLSLTAIIFKSEKHVRRKKRRRRNGNRGVQFWSETVHRSVGFKVSSNARGCGWTHKEEGPPLLGICWKIYIYTAHLSSSTQHLGNLMNTDVWKNWERGARQIFFIKMVICHHENVFMCVWWYTSSIWSAAVSLKCQWIQAKNTMLHLTALSNTSSLFTCWCFVGTRCCHTSMRWAPPSPQPMQQCSRLAPCKIRK